MKELIKRLKSLPLLTLELWVASLLISILGLSSPVFVIQVLRRYVTSGITSTLITLTTGVLVAIAMEFAFRLIRLSLARGLNLKADAELSADVFDTFTHARTGALENIPPVQRREITNHLNTVLNAYNPANIVSVFDIPFALLYVMAIFFLKPAIAVIVTGFLITGFILSMAHHFFQRQPQKDMRRVTAGNNSIVNSVIQASDSVRSFNAAGFLKKAWMQYQMVLSKIKQRNIAHQGVLKSSAGSLQALMNVCVMAAGAVYAVHGEMSVAAMIGANILASRAMGPIIRFAQLGSVFVNAGQSLDILDNFCRIPRETEHGTSLKKFSGKIELSDLSFRFTRAFGPVFESVSFVLNPGSLLVVTGTNGAGKTTMARLLTGLLFPVQGNILIDGIDLRQVMLKWWRQQIIYIPQEPMFFDGTIQENIITNNPGIDEEDFNKILVKSGLRRFLDTSPAGIKTILINGGKNLAPGIRRRIAIARALVTDGQLVVIDEPSEGMDPEGIGYMFQVITECIQRKKTLIIFSHNPDILQGHGIRLDLNIKPVPRLTLPGTATHVSQIKRPVNENLH